MKKKLLKQEVKDLNKLLEYQICRNVELSYELNAVKNAYDHLVNIVVVPLQDRIYEKDSA